MAPLTPKVALDTSPLYVTRAGVARYVEGLMKGFTGVDQKGCQITPFAWEVENHDYQQPWRSLKTLYREVFWASTVAPGSLRNRGFELLHSTGVPIISVPRTIRHVVTLHDLAPVRHPERFRRWHLASTRRGFELTRKADKVICISQFTADEGIGLLGLDPRRLEVIHQASEWCAHPPENPQPPTIGLPDDFFLFVGTLEPGKNLHLLREVYELAGQKGIQLPPLVVVGVRREGVQNEGGSPSTRSWVYAGRVNDNELAWLYSRSRALVFPSKYEGFGIPLLEAMAMSCPVICSRVASLGEVGGDAVLYADLNPESYLDALGRLLESDSLRNDLIAGGLNQCGKFSWEKNASQVIDVYRSIAG